VSGNYISAVDAWYLDLIIPWYEAILVVIPGKRFNHGFLKVHHGFNPFQPWQPAPSLCCIETHLS